MSEHVQGTRFQRGSTLDHETAVWTDIAGCKGMTPPGKSRGTIDVTTIDQLEGASPDPYKRHVPSGLIESGDAEINLVFDADSAAQATLEADIESKDLVLYRFLYPSGNYRYFAGSVTSIKPTSEMDDILRQTVGFKASGRTDLVRVVV